MKRAAIGLRVSSEKQAEEGFSLPSQFRRNTEFATTQGFEVSEEHIFREVFTGTKGDRPELNKIKALIEARQIDALIVYNADRFFRNRIEAYLMRKFMQKYDVELYYAEKGRKVGFTLDDEILNGIEELLAEVEKAKIHERMMRGRWERAILGTIPGQTKPPYGYHRVTTVEDKKRVHRFEITPEQANIVRMIFNWYVFEHWTVFKIRDELTRLGVAAPGDTIPSFQRKWGYGVWDVNPIYRILAHSAYTGNLIVHREYETRDGVRKKFIRPESEWITIQIPPIIEQDIFDLAQQRLSTGKQLSPRSKKPNTTHLFARRVQCECGMAMRTTKNYNGRLVEYYRCMSSDGPSKACGMVHVRREWVDERLWSEIEGILLQPQQLLLKVQAQENYPQSGVSTFDEVGFIDEQIKRSEKRREAILDSIIDARIQSMPDAQKNEVIASLNTRLHDVEKSLAELRSERQKKQVQLQASKEIEQRLQSIEQLADAYQSVLSGATGEQYEARRGVIDDLDIRVKIVRDGDRLLALMNILGATVQVYIH